MVILTIDNLIGKETLNNWSFQGSVKKAYDKSCKSFILLFDHATKAQIPSDPRQAELYLVQPYLMLQLMITDKKLFHIEVTVTDQQKTKRRLIFAAGSAYSYSKDNIIKQPLHARIPCDMIREGVWINLQIDIQSFVEVCFGQMNFRSVDAIMIAGACRLRKVMTMKTQIIDNTSLWLEREYGQEISQEYEQQFGAVDFSAEELAGNMNFTNGVDFINQVISFDKILFWGYLMENIIQVGNGVDKKYKKKPNIAFGSRVTEKPILEEQQKVKNALGQAKNIKQNSSQERSEQYTSTASPSQYQRSVAPLRGTGQGSDNSNPRKGRYLNQDISNVDYELPQLAGGGRSMEYQQYQTPLHHKSMISHNTRSQDDDSNVDFTQYKLTTMKKTRNMQDNSAGRGNAAPSNYQTPPKRQFIPTSLKQNYSQHIPNKRIGVNQFDDHYLNEKIKYLQNQRQIIHQLADKYGIQNNVKVEQLSLIKNVIGAHHRHDQASYLSQDPKERIKEYHQQVNERRRQIHQKAKEKRKNNPDNETLEQIKSNNKKGKPRKNRVINQTQAQIDEQQENEEEQEDGDDINKEETIQAKKAKIQNINNEDGNVDGWDNENQKDDYGNEDYGDEKDEGQGNDDNANEENPMDNEEYGEEEDQKEIGNKDADDYGVEQDEDAEEKEEEAGVGNDEKEEIGANEDYGEEEVEGQGDEAEEDEY
ncbi:UNKNOWN [Stylonychia lemnae]|uniref:CFA20 domain-containing protein n=1 Tax=Stylonychia lemnae TaxID=5949 RepID=A0A078A7C8_STYLE|nr:UNKNOWN [Stylonychia lemnae]|eukprot:CDW78155.1 UNKNOWN [Stylonychia lemnae]